MKKFMVLALVLGIAGFVNAGWIFNDDGAGTVKILGDYNAAPFYVVVSLPTGSTLDLGVDAPSLTGLVDKDAKGAGVGMPDGENGEAWTIASGLTNQPTLIGVNLLTVSYATGTTGWVVIYSVNDDTFEATEAARYYIPEPVTMMLLGLGGLFIRRK